MINGTEAIGNQPIQQTTPDTVKLKETSASTGNDTETSDQQEQIQTLVANLIGTQAISMLSQSGAMAIAAAGKANEVFEELKELEAEEERDRQQEFGMPEY